MRWAHRRWELAVAAFVDGELSHGRVDAADRHLRTCPDCCWHAVLLLAVRSSMLRHPARLTPLPPARRRRLEEQLARVPGRP